MAVSDGTVRSEALADDAPVVGVDGCSEGWFAVRLDDDWETACYRTMAELWDDHSDAERILVDMPIGLPEDHRRACDTDARSLLGCRGSSVFSVPCRGPLTEYEDRERDEASETQNDLTDDRISVQAWNLKPKITDLDDFLRDHEAGAGVRTTVHEAHPELAFYGLDGGRPVAYAKTDTKGLDRRTSILRRQFDAVDTLYEEAMDDYLRKHVARDDIVDALALAVAARGPLCRVPDSEEKPTDDEDLPMVIWYPDPERSDRTV